MFSRFTFLFSLLLILLGLAAYFFTGMVSWTALIPSILGLLIGITACFGLKDSWKRHTFLPLMVLSLLGIIGSARGFKGVIALINNEIIARPGAAITQAIMATLCIIYFVGCIRGFFSHRKNMPPHVIA